MQAVIASILMFLAAEPAPAAEAPWALKGWPFRLRLHLRPGQTVRPDIRTGTATVGLCGRGKADGSDLRLLADDGTPLPFRIDFHDPARYTHLTFQVKDPNQPVWLYFGNPQAPAIDTAGPGRQVHEPRARVQRWLLSLNAWTRSLDHYAARAATGTLVRVPGAPAVPLLLPFFPNAGTTLALAPAECRTLPPPQTTVPSVDSLMPPRWTPDAGLLVKTLRKKDRDQHPNTLAEMRQMIAEAPEVYGVRYQNEPYIGFNPFGVSDGYITVMEGLLFIDKPGVYSFCTQSDEASFLLINGQLVVEWPGAHDWEAGRYGEKHGDIALTVGRHHVEYLHEEGTGNQLAFFGWAPPDAKTWTKDMAIPRFAGMKQYSGIPPERFPLPLAYDNQVFQRDDGRPVAARFRIKQHSNTWLKFAYKDTQYDLVQFEDLTTSTAGKIVERKWDFGDGVELADQPEPQHVYLRQGRPTVRLTVKDEKGHTDACVLQVDLFDVDVWAHGTFQYADQEQYYAIARDYDPEKLDKESLEGLLLFTHGQKDWPRMARVGTALLKRFKDFPPADLYYYQMILGECYRQRAVARHAEALALFQAAAGLNGVGRNEQVAALLQAARTQWEFLNQHGPAVQTFQAVIDEYAKNKSDWMREHAITATIGIGDSLLAQGERAKAIEQYLKVREFGGYDPAKAAEREEMDRGAFENSVWDHIDQNWLDEAVQVLDQWERKYPWHKAEGTTFYLRAKVAFIQGALHDAIVWADRAVAQDPKADCALDCLWLKANSFQNLQKYDEAIQVFQTLLVMPAAKDFHQAAAQKIKDCEALKAKPAEPAKK